MNSNMIALKGSHSDWNSQSPKEMQETLEKYFEWVDGLKKAKIFEYGQPLKSVSKTITKSENNIEIVDGPYAESKEALTGFFIIKSESMEAACRIASECPALFHGESIDVIEVGH